MINNKNNNQKSENKFLKHIGILFHSEKIKEIANEKFEQLESSNLLSDLELNDEEDRMLGALFGVTWGDVIGCPVEGWRQEEIEELFGDENMLKLFDFKTIIEKRNDGSLKLQNITKDGIDFLFPSDDLISSKLKTLSTESDEKKNKRKKSPFESFLSRCRFPGIHSDDTQQGMALINSIVQYCELNPSGKYFGEIWGEWLVRGFETCSCKYPMKSGQVEEIGRGVQAFRDYGANSSKAFTNLKKNIPAHEAGSSSSGIGGIMRGAIATAVFSLFSHESDDEKAIQMIEKFSFEQNLTTHATIEGAATCFATSLCAYMFLKLGQERAIEWILDNLADRVKKAEDKWWNNSRITTEREEQEKEEKKPKKKAYVPNANQVVNKTPENELKWKIYKTLPSVNAASEVLQELFVIIKTLRATEKENTLLVELRNKISDLARVYKPEKKNMRAHVNQGFCLLAGMHAIACILLPENPEIIFHYHKSTPETPTPSYDSADIFNNFPNLLLRSTVTLGYDTDTIGAILGYLLGSRFGTSWIPLQLLFDFNRIKENYAKVLLNIYRNKRQEEQVEVKVEPLDNYIANEQFLTLIGEYYQYKNVDKYVSFTVTESNKHIYGNSSSRVELHSLENKN
ncbi:hypothetical protein NAEGRDRAFT_57440 [Naegleria gruberi]|uniref:ADP-ribosylhydrolase ARH3 n=1 Tax=Naegleria gruberi TaxID=5762 RepID=D2V889_NAEGR|nr:uncharacterized protein NAEGRDRAFT_57440 [Naegleria gruberi]EFC47136.1 hypothetical protein NAEGRDRAFT_57440 [Naegleria gruberi]|eukprot:XP_002679880.1 hypothetical protein NAEGRDRAFT_57440 [Naegleria gruberi strain NEG-M]